MNGDDSKIENIDFQIPNPELFLKFFLLFSRLEAVWKSDASCYDWERQGPRLKAIAERLKGLKLNANEVISASVDVRYLDENPPKVQIGPNEWRDYSPPAYCEADKLTILLDKIRVLRNNVFHGGKWSSLPADSTRDARLVSGAVAMIEQILKCNADWNSKMPLI